MDCYLTSRSLLAVTTVSSINQISGVFTIIGTSLCVYYVQNVMRRDVTNSHASSLRSDDVTKGHCLYCGHHVEYVLYIVLEK